MSGQINFSGNITAGPPTVTDPAPFPGGQDNVPLASTPSPKSYVRHEHKTIDVAAAVDQALDFTGITATFVYLRCNAPITFKVNGGAQALPLFGMLILEAGNGAAAVTSITVTGTAQLEYLIAG